jgi:TrmH family RNA methyltransferase
MGSLARVVCHYTDLEAFFSNDQRPVYGTYLKGASVYETNVPENVILVMGSEANGISEELGSFIDHKITIPRKASNGPESLNVAIATALILGEIAR